MVIISPTGAGEGSDVVSVTSKAADNGRARKKRYRIG
jgi:hypothetical protein